MLQMSKDLEKREEVERTRSSLLERIMKNVLPRKEKEAKTREPGCG